MVVSPLIALMKDQVDRLTDAGVRGDVHQLVGRAGGAGGASPAGASRATTGCCSWHPSGWAVQASWSGWPTRGPAGSSSTRRTASPPGATTSGLTTACWRGDRGLRAAAGGGLHRHRDAAGASGHRPVPGAARPVHLRHRVQPADPDSGRGPLPRRPSQARQLRTLLGRPPGRAARLRGHCRGRRAGRASSAAACYHGRRGRQLRAPPAPSRRTSRRDGRGWWSPPRPSGWASTSPASGG